MLKPVEDKIIVKPRKDSEKQTSSGFILTSLTDDKPQDGVVVAVGPGMTFGNGSKLEIDLKPGDIVAYAKYQGTEVEYDGEQYLILAYRDILAVIEEGNE